MNVQRIACIMLLITIIFVFHVVDNIQLRREAFYVVDNLALPGNQAHIPIIHRIELWMGK